LAGCLSEETNGRATLRDGSIRHSGINMSKPSIIRKRALEYAKKRQWEKALSEFIRLVELEEHNPNVFNELGDIHLKIGNKGEAFKAFHSAIDAYSRVGLFNNAVAVCKKIIRLNSTDRSVYGKLARLRNEQGFKKEAVTYAVAFLDRIAKDSTLDPDDIKMEITELAGVMKHSPEVLERVIDYLLKWEYEKEAGDVLEDLEKAYSALGMEEEIQRTRERLRSIGRVTSHAAGESSSTMSAPVADGGFETHRMDLGTGGSVPPPIPEAEPEAEGSVADAYHFDEVDLGRNSAAGATAARTQTSTQEMEHSGSPEQVPPPEPPPSTPRYDEPPADEPASPSPPPASAVEAASPPSSNQMASDESSGPTPAATVDGPDVSASQMSGSQPSIDCGEPPASGGSEAVGPPPMGDDEVWVPKEELPDDLTKSGDGSGEVVPVSEIVGQFSAEIRANVEAEDYRSHYDLGMAYLEMELIPEAIREFQFAANSSRYQVRSLELIGLCFLKQNQPRLAVKQLEKGLGIVGDVDRDSIGLQYNLGLAYEMMGAREKAKLCFEDVYVLDVTFRDIAEKMKQYSS